MSKMLIKQGATSVLATVFAQDASKTTGVGLGSIAWNTAGITAYYFREADNASTAITLATMTIGTWATGGLILVDGTNMPGTLQLGLPNACFANLGSVTIYVQGVANLAPILLEFQVVAFDPKDAVHLGLSAVPNATAGAANGLLIAGSNAATTFATLTSTGAFITGSFSAGAITATTVTASGAVAFQSTFAVTTSTNLAALSCSTFAAAGTVTFNAFVVTNNFTVSGNWLTTGTTTWTGAAAFSAGLACNITGNLLGTVSTLTTYTGDTPQTGDSFARIGTTGSSLTSLAPAATALSTAQWTNSRAGYLDNVGTAMTEAYAANGAAPTMVQMLYMLYSAVTQVSQAGTVLTSVKLDGATTAMSWTLNNATSPTSRVRAS
jgi:hypothetical protein